MKIIMKRTSLLWGFVLAGALFAGCSDDNGKEGLPDNPVLTLSSREVTIAETTGKVEIVSNVSWVALKNSDASWLTVNPEKGNASADAVTVNFTATENTTTSERNTVIRFVHELGNKVDSVIVKQVGKVAQPLRLRDSLALVALYEATKGYQWATRWDLTTPFSEWGGVDADYVDEGDGYGPQLRVIALMLPDQKLVGSLPDELRNLTALRELAITKATINKPLPEYLGELKKLRFIALAGNGHTGSIPENIYSLPLLEDLQLDNNALEGGISSAIRNATNLVNIDLAQNKLTGAIPAEIGQLSKLDGVKIDSNLLTSIPKEINNCKNLRVFYASNNRFNQEIGTIFDNLEKLETLELGENQLTGKLPELTGCKVIYDLRFSHNNFDSEIPANWANLDSLLVIQGMACGLKGDFPASFANWNGKGRSIIVPDNAISGTLPAGIRHCQYVDFSNNQIDQLPDEFINGCLNLELSLRGNKLKGDLTRLLHNVNVTSLDLSGMPEVTGTLPTDEEECYVSLTNLNLSRTGFSGEIPGLLFTTMISTLDLSNCNFTGNLPDDASKASNLYSLKVNGNKLTGEVSDKVKENKNWSSWKAVENIAPQQDGVVLGNCN